MKGPRAPRFVLNPTAKVQLSYGLRQRNEPFRVGVADASLMPVLAALFGSAQQDEVALRRALAKLDAKTARALCELGFLVDEKSVPERVAFDPALWERDLALIPRHVRESASGEDRHLHPGVFVPSHRTKPPWSLPEDRLDVEDPVVWLRHPATRMLFPYRSSREQVRVLQQLALRPRSALPDIEPSFVEILTQAHLLVPRGWHAAEARRFQRELENSKSEVCAGYTIVRRLLPPLFLASVRRYVRALSSEGYLRLDESIGIERRYYLHNERVLKYLHRQLTPLVTRITGERIRASYSFLSAYQSRARLGRHVDRPQCRWNVSLALDSDPEMHPSKEWPIYLQIGTKRVRALLSPGDALIYRGTDVPHWRDELGPGKRVTMGLFHFVPHDFVGSLD